MTTTQTAYASCDGDQQFTVTATSGNTSGYITTIDNPEINGAPAASPEGSPIALTATPGGFAPGTTLTYAWGVTKQGGPFASGSGPTSASHSSAPSKAIWRSVGSGDAKAG